MKFMRYSVNSYIKLILFTIGIYLCLNSLSIIYLIGKYCLVNIKDIEPLKYVADVAGLEFVEEDTVTSFNEYHPTINSIGSRNLFELTGVEEKIVVLLGDSFFFGYGLNDDETVSYFLNKFDNSKKYVNLALPGANIRDSVAIYLYYLMAYCVPDKSGSLFPGFCIMKSRQLRKIVMLTTLGFWLVISGCDREEKGDSIADELEMAGADKSALLMLDRELGTRVFPPGSPLDPTAYSAEG